MVMDVEGISQQLMSGLERQGSLGKLKALNLNAH